jgi:hypothetical protein
MKNELRIKESQSYRIYLNWITSNSGDIREVGVDFGE